MSLLLSSHVVRAFYLYGECVARPLSYPLIKKGMKDIKLILNMDVVNRYNEYYFSQHPKAKKKQIEHPYHPSINVWSIKPRIQMNALKHSLFGGLKIWDMKICT